MGHQCISVCPSGNPNANTQPDSYSDGDADCYACTNRNPHTYANATFEPLHGPKFHRPARTSRTLDVDASRV